MQKNHLKQISLLLLFSLFFQLKCTANPSTGFMPIKKFVDGDTFWVDDGSARGLKVRLIGVNTPETVDTRKPVEFFGPEASAYVKRLLNGKKVRLEYDVMQHDRYGRILAYVFLEDGTFLNAELVKNGFAQVITIPPNVKYANEFLKLQKKARAHNKGLWAKEK